MARILFFQRLRKLGGEQRIGRTSSLAGLIGVVILLAGSTSFGQVSERFQNSLADSDWYGPGVHSYYRGCYQESAAQMTTAISLKPNDPRPYYYRGLANCAIGDSYSAEADFRMGARIEAGRSLRPTSEVNRALERVQGSTRLNIERIRREERMFAATSSGPVGAGQGSFSVPAPLSVDEVPGQFVPQQLLPTGNPQPSVIAADRPAPSVVAPSAPAPSVVAPSAPAAQPFSPPQPVENTGSPFDSGGNTNPFGGGGNPAPPSGGGSPFGNGGGSTPQSLPPPADDPF